MLDEANKDLRNIFSKFATGVAAITFESPNGLNLGITINSYTSLSLDPPMVLWCLDKDSDLYEEITILDKYIINFLSEEQKDIANSLAQKNDHILNTNQFIQTDKGLVIKDSIGWIACTKNAIIDSGDHSILIANVYDSKISDGYPLVFWGSNYRSILR
jgi:flavin reductase (DIM6/NTAB) family NADH-FMN oxidoreductase RutF